MDQGIIASIEKSTKKLLTPVLDKTYNSNLVIKQALIENWHQRHYIIADV